MAHVDKMVDDFVSAVNVSFREPKQPRELPEALRMAEIDGFYWWQMSPLRGTPWVSDLEHRLPAPFPLSYRSLLSRYEFPTFDVGGVMLFANTLEDGRLELRTAIFADQDLAAFLHQERMIHFGRPVDGHADPICFDARVANPSGEYPVVRVDYEAAVRRGELNVLTIIAPSFLSMVAQLL